MRFCAKAVSGNCKYRQMRFKWRPWECCERVRHILSDNNRIRGKYICDFSVPNFTIERIQLVRSCYAPTERILAPSGKLWLCANSLLPTEKLMWAKARQQRDTIDDNTINTIKIPQAFGCNWIENFSHTFSISLSLCPPTTNAVRSLFFPFFNLILFVCVTLTTLYIRNRTSVVCVTVKILFLFLLNSNPLGILWSDRLKIECSNNSSYCFHVSFVVIGHVIDIFVFSS